MKVKPSQYPQLDQDGIETKEGTLKDLDIELPQLDQDGIETQKDRRQR